MKKGMFITLEGPDGCGKSTQAKLLAGFLQSKKYKVLLTREPGGVALAEDIRKILLDPERSVTPVAELLLYEAGRAQHAREVIAPALNSGKIVLCDRFTDATTAYQGYGRELDIKMVKQLNQVAAGGLIPELTLLLDIPPHLGLKRAARSKGKIKGSKHDRLEREKLAFHKRVRQGYLKLARSEPRRIKVVSAQGSISEVHIKLRTIVENKLKENRKYG